MNEIICESWELHQKPDIWFYGRMHQAKYTYFLTVTLANVNKC